MSEELYLELEDREWPFTYTDHDREIVRAIVFDDEGWLYFTRATRDDHFGKATLIETSGGGVALSFGEKHLMPDEIKDFHLSTLRLTFEEAEAEYRRLACTPIGRLIANRELPVLQRAREILEV